MIPAGNIVVCPVIATIGSSLSTQVNSDDSGEHDYIVKDGRDSRIHLEYHYPGKFTVSYDGQPTLTVTKTQVTSTFTDNFFFLKGSTGIYKAFSGIGVSSTNTNPNAVYIKSTIDAKFALGFITTVPGAEVGLSTHRLEGQQWFFTDDGYVQSALKAADGSDLVLDVIDASHAEGSKLQINYKKGTNAQKWIFNNGFLESQLEANLVLQGNSSDFNYDSGVPSISPVELYFYNWLQSQQWSVVLSDIDIPFTESPWIVVNIPINKAMYIKSSIDASFVLDAVSGQAGSKVQLTSLNNSQGQRWFFTDDGYVQSALKAADGSDLVLDVINGIAAAGAKLQICLKDASDAQKWILNPQGNLVSQLNGFVFVLEGPFSPDGKGALQPQLSTPNGSVTQIWTVNDIGNV